MERRLLTFIITSTAFFFVYFTLRSLLLPPPPAVQPNAAAEVAEVEDAAVEQDKTEENEEEIANSEDESAVQEALPGGTERTETPRWATLGSMDPASGHFMLMTLNSRGGAVERIELTEREAKSNQLKYRRVDVRHGYLGYFAGTSAAVVDGVTVNVVGPGTPGATAGIQVGDVITTVNGKPIAFREQIDAALIKTEPGDTVDITVLRKSDSESQPAELVLSAKLSQHPLDLIRLARDGGADQIKGNLTRLSCLMTLAQINKKKIDVGKRSITGVADPAQMVWSIEEKPGPTDAVPGTDELTFSLTLTADELAKANGEAVELVRSYRLPESSYVIDMALEVRNKGTEPHDLAYRLSGPNGLTLEGWWYSNKISPNFSGAAARDIVYKNVADGHELISGYNLLKRAKKTPEDADQTIFAPDTGEASQALKYIGVDAQYFVAAYLPPSGEEVFSDFRRATAEIVADADKIERHKERAVNTSFYLTSNVATVAPGAAIRQELRMYAGPKDADIVEPYGLGDVIYYGWFALFAKFLSGLLHFIGGVIGNYAIAIILLTVLVRGLMFPLSRKAAVNAQRMQELAPELKKISEQYKDDMEGRLKAQRELQHRVGFNPMAGCLPMFMQLPIFIGLYRALSVDIELRQKTLSSMTEWASNLAGPDMLTYWGDWLWEYLSGRGTGWLGPYFNILPVIVVGLFLLQQKLFMPPATDEQTAMTQKMMNIMTLMMGLFFFRVPAGLCLYFITSSLWGICERVLVKKTLPKGKHFNLDNTVDGVAVPTQKKKPTLADRIRDSVNKPEPKAERPNKRRRPDGGKKRS
ncbi:membrane protein insertase YidC [Novipirellula artificiosorum]|uniref:Membrane protein insertase YidC n=1 Tax=Novipirellula artificiosorum TaxID=2528016 RepID=A0A5C6E1L8_9BACT|nr:membrane protein insertase YidC [Novipirellula artificiosorum]TWU41029.1 Membrane protein insertase YidC [Novipirellula artificiosorum]